MKYTLYLLINTVTKRRYVGMTSMTLDRRWRRHVSAAAQGSASYLHRSIHKHGAAVFTKRILCYAATRPEAESKEIALIAKLRTLCPRGYNRTKGGIGAAGFTASVRKEHRAATRCSGQNGVSTRFGIGTNRNPQERPDIPVQLFITLYRLGLSTRNISQVVGANIHGRATRAGFKLRSGWKPGAGNIIDFKRQMSAWSLFRKGRFLRKV